MKNSIARPARAYSPFIPFETRVWALKVRPVLKNQFKSMPAGKEMVSLFAEKLDEPSLDINQLSDWLVWCARKVA